MPQEEPGDGQQCAGAGRVPAEPGPQGPQAREDAVQEGGVLPAEHVQHQHGLYQALREHGRLRGCVAPPPLHPEAARWHSPPSAGPSRPSSGLLGEGRGPPGLCVPPAPPGEERPGSLHLGGTPGRAQDSRRPLCSRRRWQYSRAFSRSHSAGGSRWLAVEAAESTDTVEPSSSDLSSGREVDGSAARGDGRSGGRGSVPVWAPRAGAQSRQLPPSLDIRGVDAPGLSKPLAGMQMRSRLTPMSGFLTRLGKAPRGPPCPTCIRGAGVCGARSMEKACTFSRWSSVKRWPVDSTVKKSVATVPSTSVTGPGCRGQGRSAGAEGPRTAGAPS